MLDIYAPRIRLEFRLIDRDGKVVSSGARDLRDPLYLTRARLLSTDPLRYEKYLLLEWFQRDFPSRNYGISMAMAVSARGPLIRRDAACLDRGSPFLDFALNKSLQIFR